MSAWLLLPAVYLIGLCWAVVLLRRHWEAEFGADGFHEWLEGFGWAVLGSFIWPFIALGFFIYKTTHRRGGMTNQFSLRELRERIALTIAPWVFVPYREEREEAFRDLAAIAYGSRDAVWTSPRVLVKTALDHTTLAALARFKDYA